MLCKCTFLQEKFISDIYGYFLIYAVKKLQSSVQIINKVSRKFWYFNEKFYGGLKDEN